MTRVPSLVPYPQCPRCHKPFREYVPRAGDGFPQCQGNKFNNRCGARWWFLMLAPGLVEEQLADVFGPAIAAALMAEHALPMSIPEPMAWQLEVTSHEVRLHQRSPLPVLARALGLLTRRAS